MKYSRSSWIILYSSALLFINFICVAGNKADSLKQLVQNSKENDTLKVVYLIQLSEQFDHFRSKEKPQLLIDAVNESYRINFTNGIIESNIKLITTLSHRQIYDAAFEYCERYMDFLKKKSLNDNLKEVYRVYAIILGKMGKYQESLLYNHQALKHYLSKNNRIQYAKTLSNISLLHLNNKQTDSAYFYSLRASEIFNELQTPSEYANSLLGIAEINLEKGDVTNSKQYVYRALKMYNDKSVYLGLVHGYYDLGNIYIKEGKSDSAIIAYKASLSYISGFSLPDMQRDCYKALAEAYQKKGDYVNAYNFQVKHTLYKDSVADLKLKDKSLEMDVKFDIVKKENELHDKENKIALQDKQKNFLILGIVVIIVLLGISYRNYLQKKKTNEIITGQKKLVEEKQKEILDSIQYAKRIQNTLLAHTDYVNQNLPENFILFKPKDIVSGDFYWAIEKNNKFYLAVCDSTGHGVPGAFMSLLNISFLNEAINEKGIHQPNEVFDFVRQRLIENINKEGQKDGFDGILLCVDKQNKQISYASAHNAPVLISENEIKELPTDKMPVGIGEKIAPFALYNVNLKHNDTLYLYTDGFADQFGGPKGKKFKYNQLNEMLLKLNNKKLSEQKLVLDIEFENWKGNLEQIDDVLVIGIKI